MTENSPTCILSSSSSSSCIHHKSSPSLNRRSHRRQQQSRQQQQRVNLNSAAATIALPPPPTVGSNNNSPRIVFNRPPQPPPPIIVDCGDTTDPDPVHNPNPRNSIGGNESTSEDEDPNPKRSLKNRRCFSSLTSSSCSSSGGGSGVAAAATVVVAAAGGRHQQQQQQAITSPSSCSTRSRSPVSTSLSNRCCAGNGSPSSTSTSRARSSSASRNTLSLPTELDRREEEDESSTSPNNSDSQSSQKSPKSSKVSAWKTSKFFSKSMTSSDLLKGLKKLSLSSNNNNEDQTQQQQQQPAEPPKTLRSRITNFKKKSLVGNEAESEEATGEKPKTPVKTPVSDGSQKSGQDDGIVCKKEDLKAIICSATKRIPLCSPSRKKRALRQTKSASFEPPPDKSKKEPVRRAGSEDSKSRKSMPNIERDIAHLLPKLENRLAAAASASTIATASSTSPTSHVATNNATPKTAVSKTVKISTTTTTVVQSSPTPSPPTLVLTQVVEQPAATTTTESEQPPSKAEDACVSSTVKWDDSEVVDAVLIGDAIESFLKGSMGVIDKKPALRKNSCERKKS